MQDSRVWTLPSRHGDAVGHPRRGCDTNRVGVRSYEATPASPIGSTETSAAGSQPEAMTLPACSEFGGPMESAAISMRTLGWVSLLQKAKADAIVGSWSQQHIIPTLSGVRTW